MRVYLVAALFLTDCLLLRAADSVAVPADDARLAYLGRIEMKDGKARMGFPGVTVRFAFRGPAPTLKLTGNNANCFFNLSCNGWDAVIRIGYHSLVVDRLRLP